MSLVSMVIVTMLSFVNTDQWQEAFFIITLIVVALMNAGIAVLQASLYGMIGLFPPVCISALVSGQSLAGIISAPLTDYIFSNWTRGSCHISGIIYFCLADIYLIISILAYVSVIKMEFYKEIHKKVRKVFKNVKKLVKYSKNICSVHKKVFWFGLTLGFIFMVTLAIFPSVEVYVTSVHSPSTWADVYFQPTITFLLFGVADMVGRELSRWITWPGHKGYAFHLLSFSRIIFIPLILLCHGNNKTFPTVFNQDFYYIIINILFGLTDGYFGALGHDILSKSCEKHETELAGTLMASLMGVGMVLGSCASPGFVALWGPKST
ncbi:Equilibrative nucleoside transporter 2 [Armadillidium vulgare]|nr:Equilibrative nucleoside transporter 2 [Armadillidium vulgare]